MLWTLTRSSTSKTKTTTELPLGGPTVRDHNVAERTHSVSARMELASQVMWLVRAGRGGENLDDFVSLGIVYFSDKKLGKLSTGITKEDLLKLYAEHYPEAKEGSRASWASQIARLINEVKIGDDVATWDPDRRRYILGTVTSSYEWIPREGSEAAHARRVEWTRETPCMKLPEQVSRKLGHWSGLVDLTAELARALVRFSESMPQDNSSDLGILACQLENAEAFLGKLHERGPKRNYEWESHGGDEFRKAVAWADRNHAIEIAKAQNSVRRLAANLQRLQAARGPSHDQTWRQLNEWTGGDRLAHQLAAQVLRADGYLDIDPQHFDGGPDRRADMLCSKHGVPCVAAVWFARNQMRSLGSAVRKIVHDIQGLRIHGRPGFVFLTNQYLRVAERKKLIQKACSSIIRDVSPTIEIYHLERMTSIVEAPEMADVRCRFLTQ